MVNRAREAQIGLVVRRLNFSSGSFHRWLRLPILEELFGCHEMKMNRIMGRLLSLFFRRASRVEVISFPRSSQFPRWQKAMGLGPKA